MKHGSCPAPPSTGILFKHRRRRSDASFGVDFLLLSCSWHSRKHLELMELMELMKLIVCSNCPKKLVPEGVGISPKTYFTRYSSATSQRLLQGLCCFRSFHFFYCFFGIVSSLFARYHHCSYAIEQLLPRLLRWHLSAIWNGQATMPLAQRSPAIAWHASNRFESEFCNRGSMAYQMAYHQWLILIAYQMAYYCAYHHHFLSFLAQSQWLTITISPKGAEGRIKPWRTSQLSTNTQVLFYGNIM